MNTLLIYAESAIKYVENTVKYGSPNRPEDLAHIEGRYMRRLSWPANAPRDRTGMTSLLDQVEIGRLSDGPLFTSTIRIRQLATLTKASGVGTCIGLAAVACEYLLNKGLSGVALMGFNQCNHALVVLGLSSAPQAAEQFSRTGAAPSSWGPRAVVCDPWYYEWFDVSQWRRKFPHIVNATLGAQQLQGLPDMVNAKCLAYF